jgi:hypothetical protein
MMTCRQVGEMATAPTRQPGFHVFNEAELPQLLRAAQDFRYLLGRGYPRQASLTLVGNRYQLTGAARQVLHRGVFDPQVAAARRLKLRPVRDLAGRPLALDGHNVVITLECGRRGIPVTAADDGFIRDIGQISHSFRPSPLTEQTLKLLVGYLAAQGVGPVMFWYDAPMSRSGELATLTRSMLQAGGVAGEARAVPVPEKELVAGDGAIGSSDTYLIDRAGVVVDVAGEIIRQSYGCQIIALNPKDPGKQALPGILKENDLTAEKIEIHL